MGRSMAKSVSDLTENEIVDHIARLFGFEGFDAEGDEQAYVDLADACDINSNNDAEFETFQDRVADMVPGRLREIGCSWIGLTAEEWGRRLEGKGAAEIAKMLEGEGS